MPKEFIFGMAGLVVVIAIFLLVLFDYSGVL
jgi:hypothetical protein